MEATDVPFSLEVYKSTRLEEMAQAGWSKRDINQFLDQQAHAQHAHYTKYYHDASYYILSSSDGEDIGRLYVYDNGVDIRIMDIALLSKYRGQGIGGRLISYLLERAKKESKKVSIHVEQNNPAKNLYIRLGFLFKEQVNGVYQLFEKD
ncbi:GNAT family N-acetyltransferase [Marinomonas mediterranea MMB-1]|nr:GNAT family N-acetyltransferase [Marinomonas mediterranea MMB-1]